MTMNRAYSALDIKSIDEERREIRGIATTPTPDSYGDVVEPKGAQFKLPIPFLYQHDANQPVGHVVEASVKRTGIEVLVRLVKSETPGRLMERLNEAWESIKLGLVRGLSIGFRPLEYDPIENSYGLHFTKWQWLELSAVTIPANSEASITAIKSADRRLLAASGRQREGVVRLIPSSPGVSGKQAAIKRGAVQLIPR